RHRGAAVVPVPPGVPAGAGPVVAAPTHREDRPRPTTCRADSQPLPRPNGARGRRRRLRGRTPTRRGRPDQLDQPVKLTSVLHELPPPRTGRSGRPRTKGARLGTPPMSPPSRRGRTPGAAPGSV